MSSIFFLEMWFMLFKSFKVLISLVSSSDPMTSLKCLTELFIFLTSSLLQVKFHSHVSTFLQKPFLFPQNKYLENPHSAGETKNFETKFLISIHLSYFQTYNDVQI